jgi:tetratricopeptide (TPR) repeat protein
MTPPASRLLRQLDARIASASSVLTRDCLLVERACYRARQGFLPEAEDTVRVIRMRYEQGPQVVISVRINLAEGLVRHFRDMNALAREKIHRAYALSEISENDELIALTAAWLGHMDYLRGDAHSMAKHVGRALLKARPSDHAALSRASLVAADAFHLAGRLDLAQPWYQSARLHANAEGDDATTSAHMHNMAWLRAASLRQSLFSGRTSSPSGAHALMSVDSVERFDDLAGTTNSLESLVPILRAQILSLLGEYPQALRLYEENLELAVSQGLSRMHCTLLADQAWCRLKTGDAQGAMQDATLAEGLLDPKGHHDDRASTFSRLSQIEGEIGDPGRKMRFATSAENEWAMHASLQEAILGELQECLTNPVLPSPKKA